MITALFQRNIFHENDDIHYNVLKKYFYVHEINPDHLTEYDSEGQFLIYRSSIAVAKRNKIFEKFTNALEWAGKLRKELVSSSFNFQTLDYIIEEWESNLDDDYYENEVVNSRRFIRPVSGDKLFAGNVFSIKSFQNEIDFLMQKNVDAYTLCMVSSPKIIKEEYRLIFIDGNYISGSQYMKSGELNVLPEVPNEVIDYAKKIHKEYSLPPWVVLDIGIVYGKPKVIELNQIETSSFYDADLDKIYKTWADYYE